jgi:hypothetical protein
MAKLCFSAVRAGGANNIEGSVWNVAAEVGETGGVPQSLCGYCCILPGVPLYSVEACGHQRLYRRNAMAFCEFITVRVAIIS